MFSSLNSLNPHVLRLLYPFETHYRVKWEYVKYCWCLVYLPEIGLRSMKLANPVALSRLYDDIQRAYDALIQERFGRLTPRQHQRLGEIAVPIQKVSGAVHEYENWLEMPDSYRVFDSRYRLMYAARTPMEMILQCAYFLHINHMRKNEVLNQNQMEVVSLMERNGRRLVLEIERLWEEMQAEAQQI